MIANATVTGRNPTQSQVGFVAIKVRRQGVWSSADYAVAGTALQIVGEPVLPSYNNACSVLA